MADAVRRAAGFRLAGIADTKRETRERGAREAGCPVYADAGQLAAADGIDVVYVASPTRYHLDGIRAAAAHGKHVICEKPLAASLADAISAVGAAQEAGVVLLVGATHSYDAPVRALRRVVAGGTLGQLLSVCSLCHSDWHQRPRSPEDLDAGQGNGLVLRQGAHQIDILRYLCGGKAESVYGTSFGGTAGRELGFAAQLAFAGDIRASLHYSGTGGFDTRLLTWGVGELGTVDIAADPLLGRYFALPAAGQLPAVSPVFGVTVATFTAGSAWVTPAGLLLFSDRGASELLTGGAPSGWDAALAEMDAAIRGRPPVHSGQWGLATLEAALGLHASSSTGAPVTLRHQIAVVDPADDDPSERETR
jgi:phthalate 4,5-cis-dihydrodiol dehydrogenase